MRDLASISANPSDPFEPLIAQVEKSLPGLLARLPHAKRHKAEVFLEYIITEAMHSGLNRAEVRLLLGSLAPNRFFSFLQGKVAA